MVNPFLTAMFNLRRHRGAFHRLFVLIDGASATPLAEVLRCLQPWKTWVSLAGAVEVDAMTLPAAAAVACRVCDLVMLVSHDDVLIDTAGEVCARSGATVVSSGLPPEGSRELALFQEVLHHDIELGGHNEWSGGESQFGPAVLQTLSMVHCRRRYPAYIDRFLPQKGGTQPVHALDVGCGALSRLRWGALTSAMVVTGVDPLLDMYAVVRRRHGLDDLPAVRCSTEVCAPAESLPEVLSEASVDFAYCANALDHAADPVAVLRGIAYVLRHGGVLAVEVHTREGSRENWWQLHQYDMYADESGRFMCESRDGAARDLIPPGSGLRIREYVSRNAEFTSFVAVRTRE